MTEQQLHAGAAVFDMAGEKVGLLQGYEARSDCAMIRTNTLVSACLYIPLQDIRGNDALGGLHLRLHKEALSDARYTTAPVATHRPADTVRRLLQAANH